MKYIAIVLAGLRRRLVRTILTGISIFVAFLLLGVMNGVTAGFDDALDLMSDARLRTISRANMLEALPIAHQQRIERIDGVVAVSPISIFPAFYQEQFNNISSAALDIDELLRVLPEIKLSPDEVERLKRNRTGATVGKALADRFGWKVGDRIPLTSYFLTQSDGSMTWTFDIETIHNDAPEDEKLLAGELYFHYEYLNESRALQKDTANMFISAIYDPQLAGPVADEIDALFTNSSDETQTMNEKQFLTNQMRRVGDIAGFINSIQFAVLFTLLFIAGSTMSQSAKERIAEFGVFKAVGFSDGVVASIVVAEAVTLCLLAAVLGLGVAAVVFPSIFASLGLGGVNMGIFVWGLGISMAIVLGLVVSMYPAVQIARLSVADALRR